MLDGGAAERDGEAGLPTQGGPNSSRFSAFATKRLVASSRTSR